MATYTGKVIVLTGASQGIGKALALALSPQGPKLVLAARDEAALRAVESQCRALGATTFVFRTDVTDETQCRDLIRRTVESAGGLDVLVHNAGGGMNARFDEMTDISVFEKLMRVNYLGPAYLTHEALPHLKKSRGQIVVVSSVAGLTGVPLRTAYSGTKHAVFGLFESLRIEVAEHGVSVTMIAPDFVQSEIHSRAYGADGKPVGNSTIAERVAMPAERCAALIVRAMERRQRLLVTSLRGRLGRFARLVAPRLIDRIAYRAIRRGV
ncbi:MAG TPA: SDR family oxidoreductase [Vicinamibacteria bacterium]|nr:SDR family oxidoreductase [Vicinamibacteria bacterium]